MLISFFLVFHFLHTDRITIR